MTCPDELTLTMLVDGEIEEKSTREVGDHAAACERCGALVRALRDERVALRTALQGAPFAEEVVAPLRQTDSGRSWSDLSSLGVAVSAVVFILLLGTTIASGLELPVALEWLSPFHLSGQLNLFFTGVTYGVREGGAMLSAMEAMTGVTGQSVVALLLLLGGLTLARDLSRSLATGLLASLLVMVAGPSEALEVRESERDVTIAAGETIDDTLIAVGETVVVDGTVTGDLVAAGRLVLIRGVVEGNVFAAAQEVEVEGIVGGTVMAAAQFVTAGGTVGGNLYGWGQGVTVERDSRIDGNVVAGAGTITIDGIVGRDLTVGGQRVDIEGTVQRNVTAAAEHITVDAPGRVVGNLKAYVSSPDDVEVVAGASVGGATDINVHETESARIRFLAWSFYVGQALRLAAAFLTGWLLFWLVPGVATARFETPIAALQRMGVGFLFIVAVPIAAVIAAITIIGLPLAIVAIMLWIAGLYLAKIAVAVFLGRRLLGRTGDDGTAMALLVGLVAIIVAVNVPYLGGLVNVALTLTGLGVLLGNVVAAHRARGAVEATEG